MKRFNLLFIAILFLSAYSYAQDGVRSSGNAPQSAVYLRGGLNLANVSITDDGNIDDAKMLPTFQVGLLADLPIGSFFAIQPGLFFTGKGTKTQAGESTDANYYRATTNPYYLELPVNAVFKIPMGDVSFFAGAGPYVAMGIAGKNKSEGKILGVAFESKDNIEFSNDDPTTGNEEGAGFGIMKRFDYGFNGTAGFQGKAALISVNYGLGLAKLQSGTTNGEDNNNKHRVLSVTLGIRL